MDTFKFRNSDSNHSPLRPIKINIKCYSAHQIRMYRKTIIFIGMRIRYNVVKQMGNTYKLIVYRQEKSKQNLYGNVIENRSSVNLIW